MFAPRSGSDLPQVILANARPGGDDETPGFTGLCVFLLQGASPNAGDCRPLEYAEIKDMSNKDLLKTYCLYGALAEHSLKAHGPLINTNGTTPGGHRIEKTR